MSQHHPERASKIKAAENMTAMIARPLPALTRSGEEKIWLRFAKDIWNEYGPGTQEVTTSSPKAKAVQKRKRKPTPVKIEDGPKVKIAKRSPTRPKQCKVKVTRFQYGGPDAKISGQYQNMVTLLTPCLQPTCANCWEWHAHLMRSSLETGTSLSDAPILKHPKASPLGPAIDPRILDSTWQTYQSWRNSTNDIPGLTVPSTCGQNHASSTPVVTPVDRIFATQRSFNQVAHLLTPATPKYNVFLPTPLLRHTASWAASSKTRWRKSPRECYTARLTFSTDKGKAKFKSLMHEQARKEIKREHDHLRRLQKEGTRGIQQHSIEGKVGTKPRRRHRLKLIFKSKTGKETYRRLVERYLA